MIAGKLTKSNVLGVVGGYSVPEVNRIINAFIAGAKETNPAARIKVVFINSWFDPPKAKEAAIAQIAMGADVLFGERYGVIEAAKEKNVLAFGNMLDQSSLAPDSVISSPVWDMWPTVRHCVEAVRGGTYAAMNYAEWTMMKKGGAYLAPFHRFEQRLPAEVKEMVAKRTREIMDGLFRVPVNEKIPASN
jgi:basic membrane lipoprotein Med (substrate-binding protein (PBP1-ABC) superfamily)